MTIIFISLDKGEPVSEGKRMKWSHWLSLGHVIQHQHSRGSQAQRDPRMENGAIEKEGNKDNRDGGDPVYTPGVLCKLPHAFILET